MSSQSFDPFSDISRKSRESEGLMLYLHQAWTEEGYACLPGNHMAGPVLVMLPSATWQRIVTRHRPNLAAAASEVASEAIAHGRWRRLFGRRALLIDPTT